jgi:hypothetical protein
MSVRIGENGDVLPALSIHGIPPELTKYTCYFFSIFMLLPAIPVFSIVSYKNLTQNDVFGKKVAAFAAYAMPWFLAIPFLNGQYTTYLITWASLLFVSSANYIIPFLIYFKCRVFRREYNVSRSTSFIVV